MSANMHNDKEQPLDPYLSEKLDLLREVPTRDPQAAAQGRERFLAELGSIPELYPVGVTAGILGWFKRKNRQKEDNNMNKTQRFAFSAVIAVLVTAVLLFGGAGATAFAARASLPGDTLYPVKTGLEQTQVRLSRNAYNQAQLHLRFAERRLDEIAKLIQSGRYDDVKIASAEFGYYVQQALNTLQVVMTGDPTRASQLTEQISAAMQAYVDTLKGVWVNVPEEVRPVVMQAILSAQDEDLFEDDSLDELEFTGVVEAIGADSWQVSGKTLTIVPETEIKGSISINDTVKVHAIISDDGSLVATEIQPHGMDDGCGDDCGGEDDNDNGDDANDKGDDANDKGDDHNDKGDDANDNGNDDNDKGDDANDKGDDANDKGDDGNDNGDDGNSGGDDDGDNGGGDDGGSDNGGDNGGGDDSGSGGDDNGDGGDGGDNGGGGKN